MLNKKICSIFFASLLIISLIGCGAVSDVQPPTSNNGNNQAQLVSISITPTDPKIAINTSEDFTATGINSDNTTQDLMASVTWSSSDPTVATVDAPTGATGVLAAAVAGAQTINKAGHITGKAVGKTKITATLGSTSGSTTLTVTSATLVSISVTPIKPSIAKGTTQQFAATGTYSDSTTQNLTTDVTWSSSAAGVAAISNAAGSQGLATAAAAGSTSLTVIATSNVMLQWDAPTTRSDGSPLNPVTDLSKYRIYYGTSSGAYTQSADVTNPGTTTVSFTMSLAPGTYYFAATCVDMSGIESSYSNEASTTI